MKKIVGIDIGGSSVKLAYFAGSTLKKAAMAPLPDNMVADGRILSMDAMADFLRQAARDNGIPLTNAAVVRHVMVQRIVEAYERYETAKNGGKGRK